jgi:hypothetical protein
MDNIKRIRKVSQVMQYTCYAAVVLILGFQLGFTVLIWLNPELATQFLAARDTVAAIYEGRWYTSFPAWLLYLVPSAILAYGTWRLACMFRLFKQGAYFSEDSASHLLMFSLAGFVAQFFGPVFGALAGTVAQLGNEHGEISFSIHIDGLEIIQLIAWATFMTVAWILREGFRLAKENAEFI